MLSLNDSTFSGGGDDEGGVAANSVMPTLADGDRGRISKEPWSRLLAEASTIEADPSLVPPISSSEAR
ncbi:hypothetical protein Tco_1314540 [Tanacetum coccineum]